MMNAFRGGSGCSLSHLKVIGVVCERRTARSASLRSQVYRQPVLPVAPPVSWTSATRHDPVVRERPRRGLLQIERVELVPRRMILRLEERIEVPERGEHKVSLDLREAHAEEDPADPLDVRAEDVTLAGSDEGRERLGVVPAEVDGLPFA